MSLTFTIIVAFLRASEAVVALAPVHGSIPGGPPRAREALRGYETIVERAGESLRTSTKYRNILTFSQAVTQIMF